MAAVAEPDLDVEVAYATADRQLVKAVRVPSAGTVHDAIQCSGILADFPEIDLMEQSVGVFGKICRLDSPLQSGDRVEIYRTLLADPKDQRRRRQRAKGA